MDEYCLICGEKLVVKMIPDFTGKGLHEEKVCLNDFCDSHLKRNYYNLLNVAYKEILILYHSYRKESENVNISDLQIFNKALSKVMDLNNFVFTEREESLLTEKFKMRYSKPIGFNITFKKVKEYFDNNFKADIKDLSSNETKQNFYKTIEKFDEYQIFNFTEQEKTELWNEYCLKAIIKDDENNFNIL